MQTTYVSYEKFLQSTGALLAFNDYDKTDVADFVERHGLGAEAGELIQSGYAHVLQRQQAGPPAPTITLSQGVGR